MGRIESARPSAQGPSFGAWIESFLENARDWAHGRMWIPRALLLVYLVYADVRFFHDPMSGTMFSGITLAFHEMGHVIFGFAGHFIGSLMGSGTQLLVPIIVIVVMWRQDDYFGMSVGGFWLSFSLFELANYIGDARAMELPLVGFSDDPEHDWHYLLGTLHMLPLDRVLAFLTRCAAAASGAVSLWFAIWLLNEMRKPRPVVIAMQHVLPDVFGESPPHRVLPEANQKDSQPSRAAQDWDAITGPDDSGTR